MTFARQVRTAQSCSYLREKMLHMRKLVNANFHHELVHATKELIFFDEANCYKVTIHLLDYILWLL